MSDELLEQLAEYGRYHDEEQTPVELPVSGNGLVGDRVDPVPIAPLTGDEMTMVAEMDFDEPTSGRAIDMRKNRVLGAGFALAAAIAAVIGFVLINDESPAESIDTADTTTAPTVASSSTTVPSEVLVVEAYLDALNSRDDDAAIGLL
ncbi:MAG: hypothetical protein ACR2P0_14000, partial [Acidimicrobiales bacterium]